jgi:hypothetical protein
MHPFVFLALDIAEERVREAELHNRYLLDERGLQDRTSWPRRGLANAFALVSRRSAGAAHRLDAYVAEDLRRTLSTTE